MTTTFRRTAALLLGSSAMMTFGATAAFAQATLPAASGDDAEIIVTGFRASLESALLAKRADSGIVDAINSDAGEITAQTAYCDAAPFACITVDDNTGDALQ